MRAILLAIPIFWLSACGQTAPSRPPEAERAAGDALVTGLMGGMSRTAAGDVAALTVNAGGLAFADADGEETFALETALLTVAEASAPIREGGESFAAAAPSANATRAEVRRIIGAAPEALCGGLAATHVALVSGEPLTGLQLMAFSGADAPGPGARDSTVCAIFAYAVD